MSKEALQKGFDADIVLRNINCDIFVIPNKGSVCKNYFLSDSLEKRMKEICEMNEITFDPETDKLFQFWATNDQFENMNDHGFRIDYNGWTYSFLLDSNLPAKLFEGKSEKDIVTVTIPMKPRLRYNDDKTMCEDFEDDEGPKAPVFWIDFNFELNQESYRYRNFGKFEDVLKQVVA